MSFPGGSDSKESACNMGELGLIPGLERSPGGGNGNPFQDSCLENPMDRGAWWAIQSTGSQRVRHNWSNVTQHIWIHITETPKKHIDTHKQDLLPDQLIMGTFEWCGSAGLPSQEQTRPRTKVKNRTFILLARMVDSSWSFFFRGCGRPSGLERTWTASTFYPILLLLAWDAHEPMAAPPQTLMT